MLRVLLSPSQREALFCISGDISEQALVQQYTFSAADLPLINSQREAHNRLGFAVQLAYLRFPAALPHGLLFTTSRIPCSLVLHLRIEFGTH
jgi:TnpA family transposase